MARDDEDGPQRGSSGHELGADAVAEAASEAASRLADHLRGNGSARAAEALATQLRGVTHRSGSGSLSLGGGVPRAASAATGHLTLGGTPSGSAAVALLKAGCLSLGGRVLTATVMDRMGVTDSATAIIVPKTPSDEPATLTDIYAALMVVIEQLDDYADGRRTWNASEMTQI